MKATRKRSRPSARSKTPLRTSPPDGVEARPPRLLARDSADEVLPLGLRRPWFGDLYHRTLRLGWWSFLWLGALVYVAANVLFALLFMLEPDGIANARPGSFWDAFFFVLIIALPSLKWFRAALTM